MLNSLLSLVGLPGYPAVGLPGYPAVGLNPIKYESLTEESVAEFVEFIDWSLVSSHLLTEDIKKAFSFLPGLKARLWFEDLLSQMVIKEDQDEYPNKLLFFIEGKFYMEFDLKNKILWSYNQRIWLIFEKKYNFNYRDTRLFITNIAEMYFKMKIKSERYLVHTTDIIEQHFKNIESTIIWPPENKNR